MPEESKELDCVYVIKLYTKSGHTVITPLRELKWEIRKDHVDLEACYLTHEEFARLEKIVDFPLEYVNFSMMPAKQLELFSVLKRIPYSEIC